METRVNVTSAQLLAELLRARRSGTRPDGAYRTKELKKALGWSMDSVRDALWELKGTGVVECIHISVETLSGKNQMIPHYRIKDGEEIEQLVELMLDGKDKEISHD